MKENMKEMIYDFCNKDQVFGYSGFEVYAAILDKVKYDKEMRGHVPPEITSNADIDRLTFEEAMTATAFILSLKISMVDLKNRVALVVVIEDRQKEKKFQEGLKNVDWNTVFFK